MLMEVVFWNRPLKAGNRLRLALATGHCGGYYQGSAETGRAHKWKENEARSKMSQVVRKRGAGKVVRRELARLEAFDEGARFDEEDLLTSLHLGMKSLDVVRAEEDYYPFDHFEEDEFYAAQVAADYLMAAEVEDYEKWLDRLDHKLLEDE
jgi:hypothetical protein